ncbi:MAG: hypothetical protein D6714_00240 [Bacteroidetes bacterium]|nr:MAG: hypothetical protein D6714_00240 [Bacteroidota bacterium]
MKQIKTMRTHILMAVLGCLAATLGAQNLTFDDILDDLRDHRTPPTWHAADIFVIDSIYCFSTDPQTGLESPATREYNLEFTEDGQVIRRLRQSWDTTAGDWVNERFYTAVFNDQNLIVELIEQAWDTMAMDWVNDIRTLQTPNANGLFTEILTQFWDAGQQDWRNESLNEFEYDGAGNNTTLIAKKWDADQNQWVNAFKIFNAFDNGRLAADLFQLWNAQTAAWENGNRSFHSYNPTGTKSEILSEIWNAAAPDPFWQRSSRQKFEYNADGLQTLRNLDLWDNVDSAWIHKEQNLDTYTPEGWNDSTTTRFWADTTWVNIFLTARNFDEAGNMTRFEIFLFQNGDWQKVTTCDFFWRLLNPVAVRETPAGGVVRYANPAAPGDPVFWEKLPGSGKLRMALFDGRGHLFFEQKVDNEGVMNLPSDISDGFYTLVIFGEEGLVFSGKIFVYR